MPRLLIDTMGGDHAPRAVLLGIIQALPELEGELVLVGPENQLHDILSSTSAYRPLYSAVQAGTTPSGLQVSILDAPEVITMDDSIKALRSKPNSSIVVGAREAAQSWKEAKKNPDIEPAAFLSAGNSAAMMAAAAMSMGRIKGIERPAIAISLPTISEKETVVLDVGANVDCKPEHLRDFAVMGAIFAQVESQFEGPTPKVALLSNGEELSKGNEVVRDATKLIQEAPSLTNDNPKQVGRFIGYVEGKEIFKGEVDVVVADGFIGNVVLKSLEGLGTSIINILKSEAKRSLFAPLGFLLASTALRRLKRKLDYAEKGGAPLLGVAGYAFISHGRSNPKAIKNAILRMQTAVRQKYVERLEATLLGD